jgi:thiol-disulfide isomerase/thioredoxin
MAHAVQISSPAQFSSLLSSSRVVVVNFYEEGNTASKALATVYEQLAAQLTRPNAITFTTVNLQQQPQIAQSYSITTTPTFMIFKSGREVSKIRGAKLQELSDAIKKLAAEAESDGASGGFGEASSGAGTWHGAGLPRGYTDITSQVDMRGIELLNSDSDFGDVRTLFETTIPSTLATGKGKGASSGSESKKDWIESDVDEQLMLFMPFNATLKVHTIQLTSLPPKPEDDEDAPMRPRTVRLYANQTHNLGFEEADDVPATQSIELKPTDWDEKTGTAKLELRFVKFQNITSLVLFVVDGDGEGDKVRLDRVRIIGDAGEKREMGKLEKIGDDP